MKLVSPDEPSDDEQAIRNVLLQHPILARRMTLLFNRYRELVRACLADPEPADALKILRKCENEMERLGIDLLDTHEQWRRCQSGE